MDKHEIPRSKKSNNPATDVADPDHWKKIRAGDIEAFSLVFRKYYQALYLFAGRFVKDSQSADNIVQDVFVKIWSKREKLQITSNLKSYLFTSVRNHTLNYLKQKDRMKLTDFETEYQVDLSKNPEEQIINKELQIAVDRTLNNLPEKCRQIYLMKRYHDLSYAEIAEIQKISINTVKTQMKRALKYLLKNLAHLISNLF